MRFFFARTGAVKELAAVCVFFAMAAPAVARAAATQNHSSADEDTGPRQTLIGALEAACGQNPKAFSPYLLAPSAAAFDRLTTARQLTVLKRFSMTTVAGKAQALLDDRGRMVVRCNTPAETVTLQMGPAQIDHNVAFITVAVTGAETTQFGLVRQPAGWRLYSLGILVLNIPALIQEWQAAEMQADEQNAIEDLLSLKVAIETYHDGFAQWPEKLEQLGPAPPNEVSPEHAQLVTAALASGTTDGYRFRFRLITGPKGEIRGFELGAVPAQYGETGRRSFFLDAKGNVHGGDDRGAPATEQDPAITPPAASVASSG